MWAWKTGGNRFDIRIWERGAGETLGCGTGACAVGVAAQMKHSGSPDTETIVASKGGELRIRWSATPITSGPMHYFDVSRKVETERPIIMTGPAVRVYQGKF